MNKIAFAVGLLWSLTTLWAGNETTTSAPLKDVGIVAEKHVSASDYYFGKEATGFSDLSSFSYVELGFDVSKQAPICANCSWDLKVLVEVDFFDRTGARLGQPSTKELAISYNAIKGKSASIKDFIDMAGAYSVHAKVISVTSKFFNGTTEVNETPAIGTYLSATTAIERYYELDITHQYFQQPGSLEHSFDSHANQVELSWTLVKGAEEYELEYVYIDDFKDKSDLVLNYDFKSNSTRVLVKYNQYSIALMYNKGYLLYRVRPVGRTGTNFKTPLFGLWSSGDLSKGPISSFPYKHQIVTNPQLSQKNWQYSVSFAEEGKKKDNVSYFDGILKPRQVQTINNSNKDVIVGETIYDHVGRPVIQTLPTPLDPIANKGDLYYKPGMTMYNSSTPYSKEHFDKDEAGNCAVNPLPMDSISGANKYYSTLNPKKDNENAYIPRAEGFAFSQVEYMDDNTGRVSRQSGVGKSHKLGSGKETFTKYADVSDTELDRLFGNDVGYPDHYKKTIVKDPNGQYSVSYTDLSGKVVATMLVGEAPQSLTSLESNTGTQEKLTDVLLSKSKLYDPSAKQNVNRNKLSGQTLTFNYNFVVLKKGTYEFEYKITPEELADLKCKNGNALNLCHECVYDLKLTITNVECQEVKYNSGWKKIGTLATACSSTPNTTFDLGAADAAFKSILLDEGSYIIHKELVVNNEALEQHLKTYLETYEQTCTNEFTTTAKEKDKLAHYICENDGCKECEENLGATYDLHRQKNGSSAYSRRVYYRELMECRDRCGPKTNLDMLYQQMLADVSPSGQYGCKNQDSSCFKLSVYNLYNRLSKNMSAPIGNWRKPMYNPLHLTHPNALPSPSKLITNEQKKHYFNEYGDVSVIPIKIKKLAESEFPKVEHFAFEPEIYHTINEENKRVHLAKIHKIKYLNDESFDNGGEVVKDEGEIVILQYNVDFGTIANTTLAADEAWAVEPHDLQNLTDFFDNWEEAWAISLVINHPEYCYYEYLTVATHVSLPAFGYTSDEFDQALLDATFKDITTKGIDIGDSYNEAVRHIKGFKLFTEAEARNPLKVDFVLRSDPFFMDPIHKAQLAEMTEKLTKYASTKKELRKMVAVTNRIGYNYHLPQDISTKALEDKIFTDDIPEDQVNLVEEDWKAYIVQYLALKREILKQQANNYCTSNGPLALFGGNNSCIQAKDGFNPGFTAPHMGIYRDWFFNSFFHPCGFLNYRLYKDKVKRFAQDDQLKYDELGCETDPEEQRIKYDVEHYLRTGQHPILRDLEYVIDGLASYVPIRALDEFDALTSYPFLGRKSRIMGPDLHDHFTYGRKTSVHFQDKNYLNHIYKWNATYVAEPSSGTYKNRIEGKFTKYEKQAGLDVAPNFSLGTLTLTLPANKTYTYVVSTTGEADLFYNIPLSFDEEVSVTPKDSKGDPKSSATKIFAVAFTHFFNAKYIGQGATASDYSFIGKGAFEIKERESGKAVASLTLTIYENTCIPIDGSQDLDLSNRCADSPDMLAIAKLLSTMAYAKKLGCSGDDNVKIGTPRNTGETFLKEFFNPVLNKYLYNNTNNTVDPNLDYRIRCAQTQPCTTCVDPPDFTGEEEEGEFELEEVAGPPPEGSSLQSPVPPSPFTEALNLVAEEALEDMPAPLPPDNSVINNNAIDASSVVNIEFPATRAQDDAYMNLELRPDFSNSDFDKDFQSFKLDNLAGFTCIEEGNEPNTFYIVGLVYNPATGKVNKIRFLVKLDMPATLNGQPNPYALFQFRNCVPPKRMHCDNDPNRNRTKLETFLNEIVGDDQVGTPTLGNYDNGIFKHATTPILKDLSTVASFDEYLKGKFVYRNLVEDIRHTNQAVQYRGDNYYATHFVVNSLKNAKGEAVVEGIKLDAQWICKNEATEYSICKLSLIMDEKPAGVTMSQISGIRNLKSSNEYSRLAGNYGFTATAVYYKDGKFGTLPVHGFTCLPLENCEDDCSYGGFREFSDGNFNDPSVATNKVAFSTDFKLNYKDIGTGDDAGNAVVTKALPTEWGTYSQCATVPSSYKSLKDHTGGLSHMLVMNADDIEVNNKPKRAWFKNVKLERGKTYTFEAYVANPAGFGCDAPMPTSLSYLTELTPYQDGSTKAILSFGFTSKNVTVTQAIFDLGGGTALSGDLSKPGEAQIILDRTALPANINIKLQTKEHGVMEVADIFKNTLYNASVAKGKVDSDLPASVYKVTGFKSITAFNTCDACTTGTRENNPTVRLYYTLANGDREPVATLKGVQISPEKGWVKMIGVFEYNWNINTVKGEQYLKAIWKDVEIGIEVSSLYPSANIVAIDDIALLTDCGSRTEEVVRTSSPCENTKQAVSDANTVIYNQHVRDQLTADFKSKYIDKCLRAAEDLLMKYEANNYHYTLYYYDQSGNLTMTVPPKGVRVIKDKDQLDAIAKDRIEGKYQLKNQPHHTLATSYRFNSLNQTVAQSLPDHEQFNIWQVTQPNTGDKISNSLSIKDIDFANANQAVALANNASGISSIYTTSDGAKNWAAITKIGIKDVNAAQFITEDLVYAVGNEGKLLVSTNKGQTWSIYQTATEEDLAALYFSDESQGFVLTKTGKIFAHNPNAYAEPFEDWTQGPSMPYYGIIQDMVRTDNGVFYVTIKNGAEGALVKLHYNGTWSWTYVETSPAEKVNVARYFRGNLFAAGENGLFMNVFNGRFSLFYHDTQLNIVDMFADEQNGNLYARTLDNSLYVKDNWGLPYKKVSNNSFVGLVSTESGVTSAQEYYQRSNGYLVKYGNNLSLNITKYDPVNKTGLAIGATGSSFVTLPSPTTTVANTFGINNIQDVLLKPVEYNGVKGFTGAIVTSSQVINIVRNVKGAVLNPADVSFVKYFIPVDGERTYNLSGDYQKLYALGDNNKMYMVVFGSSSGETANITLAKATEVMFASALPVTHNLINSIDVVHLTALNQTPKEVWSISTENGVYMSTDFAAFTEPFKYITPTLNGLSEKQGNQLKAGSTNGVILTMALNALQAKFKCYGTTAEYKDVALESDGTGLAVDGTHMLVLNGTTANVQYNTEPGNRVIPVARTTSSKADYFFSNDKGIYLRTENAIIAEYATTSKIKALVQSPSGNTVLAVGENGTILKKEGAGSWTHSTQIDALQLCKIALVPNTSIYYAVGKNGTLLKSKDQGATWASLKTAITNQFNCIALSAEGTGFIGGNNGKLYKLENDAISLVSSTLLNSITAHYTDIAYSGGHYVLSTASGTLVHSVDATAWQANTSLSQRINALAFASSDLVYAAGATGTLAKLNLKTNTLTQLKTTSGNNWTTATLNDIYFTDYNTGYVIGEGGTVLKTVNRGETWLPKGDPALSGSLMAISAVSGSQLYIAQQNGSQPGVEALYDYADKISQRFWYDKVGRIMASQNTKQFKASNYSYSVFDQVGKPYESGEVTTPISLPHGVNPSISDYMAWINNPNGSRHSVTNTYYNTVQFAGLKSIFTQDNLINRISSVTHQSGSVFGDVEQRYKEAALSSYDHAYHYSYDIHGAIKTLLSENVTMGSYTGHYFKRIDYDYDLFSGKVNEVTYQKGEPDMFKHRYVYDADNRLTHTYTSRDGLRWQNDASYLYYRHGPLARTELGEYKVQGQDHAYTIQGWIKGVNSSSLLSTRDIGKDGADLPANLNKDFAADEYGYTLGYFHGDYRTIGQHSDLNSFQAELKGASLAANRNLYNGNISNMTTAIAEFGRNTATSHKPTFLSLYQYDQLHRIKQVNKYYGAGLVAYNNWESAVAQLDFAERFSYDANGNITFASRNGKSFHPGDPNPVNECTPTFDGLDKLYYQYHTLENGYREETNKLRWVDETAPLSANTGDLEDQDKDNYAYDEIGNLIKDTKDQVGRIDWNVSGKVTFVQRTSGSGKPTLNFGYDACGQRAYKRVSAANGSSTKHTFYVRDAQGNVMAHYEHTMGEDKVVLKELPIYGSTRLGMLNANVPLKTKVNPSSSIDFDPVYQGHIQLEGNNSYILGMGQKGYVLKGTTFTGTLVLNPYSSLVVMGTATPSGFVDNGASSISNWGTLKTNATTLSLNVSFNNFGYFEAINDFTLPSTSLQLNEGTLKVGGHFALGENTILLNRGSLIVQGNVNIAQTNSQIQNEGATSIGQTLQISQGKVVMSPSSTLLMRSLDMLGANSSIMMGTGTGLADIQVSGDATLANGANIGGTGLRLCVKGILNHPVGSIGGSVQQNACGIQNILAPGEQRCQITLGDKDYELNNHLGNVLVTVTDKKILSQDGWVADVASATDYYAFGASMRSSGSYRYGFNGQERETEISSGITSAEYWMYDGRLGRRLNVEPVRNGYEGSYTCFGNNPIANNDPLGLYKTKAGAKFHRWLNGMEGEIDQATDSKHKGEWYIAQNYSYTSSSYDPETNEHTDVLNLGTNRVFKDEDNQNYSSDLRLSIHYGEDVSGYSDDYKKRLERDRTFHVYATRLNEDVRPIVEAEADLIFTLATGLTPSSIVKRSVLSNRMINNNILLRQSAKKSITVTEDVITKALATSNMKTLQGKVSLPMVQRYVTMLEEGSVAPAIKVADDVIIEGNHRYVAGRIFGVEPAQIPYVLSPSQLDRVMPMNKTVVSLLDWLGH